MRESAQKRPLQDQAISMLCRKQRIREYKVDVFDAMHTFLHQKPLPQTITQHSLMQRLSHLNHVDAAFYLPRRPSNRFEVHILVSYNPKSTKWLQYHNQLSGGTNLNHVRAAFELTGFIFHEARSPFRWIEPAIAQYPKCTYMTSVFARGGPVPIRSS